MRRTLAVRHLPFLKAIVDHHKQGLPSTSERVGFLMYRLLDTWLEDGVVTVFGVGAQEGIRTIRKIIGDIPDSEAALRNIMADLLDGLEIAKDNNPFLIASCLSAYGEQLYRVRKTELARYVAGHLRDMLESQVTSRSHDGCDMNLLWMAHLQCANIAFECGDIEEADNNYMRANKLAHQLAH